MRTAYPRTVAELCADAHYYFAHSLNSPWKQSFQYVSGTTPTYTLSHQGQTICCCYFEHFFSLPESKVGFKSGCLESG